MLNLVLVASIAQHSSYSYIVNSPTYLILKHTPPTGADPGERGWVAIHPPPFDPLYASNTIGDHNIVLCCSHAFTHHAPAIGHENFPDWYEVYFDAGP